MWAFLFVLLNIILNVRSSNNNGADQKRFDGFQENQKCYTNVGENLSSVMNMFSRLWMSNCQHTFVHGEWTGSLPASLMTLTSLVPLPPGHSESCPH